MQIFSNKCKVNGAKNNFEMSAKLKFEEAIVSGIAGDTKSAIRRAKVIINSITNFKSIQETQIPEVDSLLAETYLQCGRWLMDYKIDSAAVILNEFLKPAAEEAKKIHEQRSKSTCSLLSSSCFTLGDFVANLYDTIERRVQSHEWKVAGLAADNRSKELAKCEALLQEKKKLYASEDKRLKKNKAKILNGIEREYKDIAVHTNSIRREVQMDTKERDSVEASLNSYLSSAISSFGTALAHCDYTSDNSKYLFRMISLWFRYKPGVVDSNNINTLIGKLLQEIPSFRFIPLIYQLFSRIDIADDSTSSQKIGTQNTSPFQSVLQNLVSRICIDHPYHSLLQLLGKI